jgi:hypothetical protein
MIQVVPQSSTTKEPKIPFPQDWLGKPKEYLQEKIKGLNFCHPANFLAGVETPEIAQEVIKIVIDKERENHPKNIFLPENQDILLENIKEDLKQ